jgi:hypothetical protein
MNQRICKVDACDGVHKGHGYCNKHYQQFKNYGHIIFSPYEPNEFIFKNNIVEIVLRDRKRQPNAIAIIDIQDFKKIKDYHWYLNSSGYVHCKQKGFLHHLIPPYTNKWGKDHIDGDPLNNRRSNLRPCDDSTNQANKRMLSNNTSGFKGVTYNKANKNWRSQVCCNKVIYRLGSFKDKIEAARAYDEKALELFGNFAKTNKMLGLL